MISALITVHLPLRAVDGAEREEDPERLIADAREGFAQLRREPGALMLSLLVGAQFVVIGALDVLYTVTAIDVLDMGESGHRDPGRRPWEWAGWWAPPPPPSWSGRRRMSPALGAGIIVTGIPLALVAFAQAPPFALVMLALSGAGKAFFDVAGRTLLQRTVRDEVLARIFGVQEGLLMAGLALGSIAAPVLVALFGARGAFVAAGAFLPLLGAVSWGRLRRIEEGGVVPGPELAVLLRIPFFQPLSQPVLERLSWNLVPVTTPAGSVVIREGDPGDRFYMIEDGTVSVVAGGVPIATLGPGGYFGEIALLRNVPRTATITADTDLRLLALERDDFLAAVTGSRPSAERADQEMDRRLGEHQPPGGR